MIDSHCHIDLPAFDRDRDEVIQSSIKKGVSRILVPGLGLVQTRQLLPLKHQYPMLDIAAGFHPYFLQEIPYDAWQRELNQMNKWLEIHHQSIVAIGEFGLDATLSLDMAFQEQVFRDQLSLAKQYRKPVVLHHRKSHNDIIRIIKQEKFINGGVIHAFSGSVQIAQTYIDLGFRLGIGGTITYPRGQKTRNTLAHLSTSNMLLETDAPDMPLYGKQGMRNSPERLPLIAQALAKVKDTSVDEIIAQTTQNYLSLFSVNSPV